MANQDLNLGNASFSAANIKATTFTGALTGNATTATNVAGTGITGTTLASNVVTSSLTAVGTIATGVWQGTVIDGTYINYNTTNLKVTTSQLNTIQDIATTSTPTFVKLITPNSLGDKFIAWDAFGLGLNSNNLNLFFPSTAAFSLRDSSYSGTEFFKINSSGAITLGTWNGTTIGVAYGGTGASTFTLGSVVFAGTSGVYTQDNANFFWDDTNNRLGINTATPATAFQVGAKVSDDGSVAYTTSAGMFVNQTPTASATLNDPKSVLYLTRQGTGGQAYGAKAVFQLSRYENVSVNSRTRLDITLANGNFDEVSVLKLYSNGNIIVTGGIEVGDRIIMADKVIYIRSDSYHALRYAGSTSTFASVNPDGPALYGYSGGILGSTDGGEKIALQWDASKNVTVNGTFTATTSIKCNRASSTVGGSIILQAETVGGYSDWTAYTYGGIFHVSSTDSGSISFMVMNNGSGTAQMDVFGGIYSHAGISEFVAVIVNETLTVQNKRVILETPGFAQGEQSNLTFYATFTGTGDNGKRRAGDIFTYFSGGAWGYQYMQLCVGNGTSSNDAAAATLPILTLDALGNVALNAGAISTSATSGFMYISTCAGTPTGTPKTFTGDCPMVYDTTNNKLYIYNGAWKSATFA